MTARTLREVESIEGVSGEQLADQAVRLATELHHARLDRINRGLELQHAVEKEMLAGIKLRAFAGYLADQNYDISTICSGVEIGGAGIIIAADLTEHLKAEEH